jgi:hypothetical protein
VAIATAVPALAADTAAESPRLKYLPNDYWLVAECDVGTIMKFMSSEGAKNNPQYAQFQQYLQLAKQFTGIDLETDVTWATVFATGKLEKPKGLVVVQGTFNNAAVIKRLTKSLQGNIVEDEYKKHTLYTIDSATFCFPEASTILLGDEDTVKEALDQLAEGKRKLPESLKAVLGRTKTNSLVWAAVRPQFFLEDKDNLPEWLTADAELLKALNKIECVSVTAEVSQDGLTFKGLGYVPKGEAKSVYQYLSDRKKNLLHHEGTNVLFTTLLILAEVKMDDTFIQGSFRLTTESLKELWNTKLIVRPESSGSGKEPQGRDK